ncbi:DHH family phosphoesterase [Haloplanus ruber]|uniref:DHH family phosphoesterase n=1 Tax=Haloplanus ruber TaxID=869892 RepID=A0ABD6CUR8_9EURY|nr:phosphohydrolase [Haloplanus ruber]
MDDDLIDDDDISLSRKSRLPGAGFFYPDSLDEEYADRRAREAIEGAEAVVVADGDADGLACVALLRERYDAALDVAPFEASLAARLAPESNDGEENDEDETEDSPVGLVTASPHSLSEALDRVADYADPGVDVYVCDLCPDDESITETVEAVTARASTVRWFDHHQWDDDVAAAVRAAGVDLVIGASDEECTADVALRSLDDDFPEHLVDLAAVTRDHDLWIKEDPRSDDLADYAHWASAEEYVTVVGRYGPALPEPVVDYLDHRRVEKERLIERAVDRADLHAVGPWTVGVTYGRCSQNEVAEALREQGADASVIVKPAGSASIRGSEGFERCHEVAEQVNGGGHPRAAGCKPDIYDDMLDYAHHWTTEGATTKRVILSAFKRLLEDDETADE